MDTQLQRIETDRGLEHQPIARLSEEKLRLLRRGKQGLTEATIATYGTVVRQFNKHLDETQAEIGEESVMSFFEGLRARNVSPSTFNVKKYALLKILRSQVADGDRLQEIALEKVFENVETYEEQKTIDASKALSEEDVVKVIKAARVAGDEKIALCIEFLFKTGCRVTEMLTITRRGITFNLKLGRVSIRLKGKGNKIRVVEIPVDLYERLSETTLGETYLFEGLTRHQCYKRIHKVGKSLGLLIGCHTFRHSRATDLHIRKGVSLTATSRFLGHASVKTTAEMYVHDQVDYESIFKEDKV